MTATIDGPEPMVNFGTVCPGCLAQAMLRVLYKQNMLNKRQLIQSPAVEAKISVPTIAFLPWDQAPPRPSLF